MGFERLWTAEILRSAPLIAPARSFVWPLRIEGEEDALERGAVHVMVHAPAVGAFLVTAALGFKDASMPTGLFGCPRPDEVCVLAGGYAYIGRLAAPENVTLLAMKPVIAAFECVDERMLVFVGFTTVMGWGTYGKAWESRRLSWEGLRITAVDNGVLRGLGWDLMKDEEVAFEVDLKTGVAVGGGYRLP